MTSGVRESRPALGLLLTSPGCQACAGDSPLSGRCVGRSVCKPSKEHFLVIWADLKEHGFLLSPQSGLRVLSSSLGPGRDPSLFFRGLTSPERGEQRQLEVGFASPFDVDGGGRVCLHERACETLRKPIKEACLLPTTETPFV